MYLGTDGADLSRFLTVNNLVKFSNFETIFRIPKDHAPGHPSVKLKQLVSSQRVVIIIFLRPKFWRGCNLCHFVLLVLGSTRFLQSFLGYESKSKI